MDFFLNMDRLRLLVLGQQSVEPFQLFEEI